MDSFMRQKSDDKTLSLGQRFRHAREAKLMTLEDVQKSLRIKLDWLVQLEQDNYQFISPAYLKGYLRGYSRFLNIRLDPFELPELQNMNTESDYSNMFDKKQVSTSNKFMKWITFSIISLLIILVIKWWHADVISINSINMSTMNGSNPDSHEPAEDAKK